MTSTHSHATVSNTVGIVRLPREEVVTRLQGVDHAVLLPVLAQLTGDLSVVTKYTPHLAVNPALPGIGAAFMLDDETRDEVIGLIADVLDSADQKPYLQFADLRQQELMALGNIAVGEEIEQEYHGVLLEVSGMTPHIPQITGTIPQSPEDTITILGAGMGGISLGVFLQERGYDYEIFEASREVGGVWSQNTYPGVGVDVPAIAYSLSFDLNPDWTHYFPDGGDYHEYLTKVAHDFGVIDHVRFGREILRLRWIDEDGEWEITSRVDGENQVTRSRWVITAAGILNRPLYPNFEGEDTFRGAIFHANRWDHTVPTAGKRVAIIGAGATSIQVTAAIAPETEHFTLFQRQPHWVSPNQVGDGLVPADVRWANQHIPFYMYWARFKAAVLLSDRHGYPNVKVDEEWMKEHPDSVSPINAYARSIADNYLKTSFADRPDLLEKMTPDFMFMGKRPVRDPADFGPGSYYWALAQPNADVETSGVAKIVPEGIITGDGQLIELDVIIYATGLRLEWLSPIEIIGRDGDTLGERWADNNPTSYLAGLVPGFPNLFVTSGPNTGSGHAGGHTFFAETQAHYVIDLIQTALDRDATLLEVRPEAYERHVKRVDERMSQLIWAVEHRAHTYYRNNAGRVIMNNPYKVVEFWEMSRKPEDADLILTSRERAESAA